MLVRRYMPLCLIMILAVSLKPILPAEVGLRKLSSGESETLCFSREPINPFPQVIGGGNGNTRLYCIAYDSINQAIVVGGTSESTDIVDGDKVPIIMYMDENTGAVKWHRQIVNNESSP